MRVPYFLVALAGMVAALPVDSNKDMKIHSREAPWTGPICGDGGPVYNILADPDPMGMYPGNYNYQYHVRCEDHIGGDLVKSQLEGINPAKISNVIDCYTKCSKIDACFAFTFDEDNAKCNFKSVIGPADTRKNHVIFGVRENVSWQNRESELPFRLRP